MQSQQSLNIILIEPFYTGSHKSWADNYKKNSQHNITILSLQGIYWKWRMHGGAITLAKIFNDYICENCVPDLLIVTDMLNLPVFLSLIKPSCPIAVYFHENQLSYPWSPEDQDVNLKRDLHYHYINYTSSLISDFNLFNSKYHLDSYITSIENI